MTGCLSVCLSTVPRCLPVNDSSNRPFHDPELDWWLRRLMDEHFQNSADCHKKMNVCQIVCQCTDTNGLGFFFVIISILWWDWAARTLLLCMLHCKSCFVVWVHSQLVNASMWPSKTQISVLILCSLYLECASMMVSLEIQTFLQIFALILLIRLL